MFQKLYGCLENDAAASPASPGGAWGGRDGDPASSVERAKFKLNKYSHITRPTSVHFQ